MTYKNLTRPPGHWLRRSFHLLALFPPYLYYWQGKEISAFFNLTPQQLVSAIVILVVLFEILRLNFKFLIYGQRSYESNRISSIAWTFFSVGLVLLAAPHLGVQGAGIGLPLIWTACLCDLIMGEFRISGYSKSIIVSAGIMVALVLWIFSIFYLNSQWWIMIVAAPATVYSELLEIPVDDNCTMSLIPLALIYYLYPWFSVGGIL